MTEWQGYRTARIMIRAWSENKLVNNRIHVGRNTTNKLSSLPDRQISRKEALSLDAPFCNRGILKHLTGLRDIQPKLIILGVWTEMTPRGDQLSDLSREQGISAPEAIESSHDHLFVHLGSSLGRWQLIWNGYIVAGSAGLTQFERQRRSCWRSQTKIESQFKHDERQDMKIGHFDSESLSSHLRMTITTGLTKVLLG
jgi:hypothetical protein